MYNRSFLKSLSTLVLFSTPIVSMAEQSESTDTESSNTSEQNIVVVTANRTKQNINNSLAAIEVITREDIERLQPESITDLLENVVGFDIAYNGGAGQSSSLFTRGTESDHTLVLVDGIRVGSATSGNKSFSTIPVAQIERIEIVKGPRASLWGSDAIGGVIQIFTRQLANDEYSIGLSFGSDKFKSTNASFGFGSPKIQNTVTLSFEESGGYDVLDDSTAISENSEPDNDGYQRISAAIRGVYELSTATDLDWVFQYDEGTNLFDNKWGANETDYNNYFWNIRYTYHWNNLSTEFSINQSKDEQFSFDSRVVQKVGSVFETKRSQVNLLTQYELNEIVNFSAGLEQYRDDISKSKVLQFGGSFGSFAVDKRDSKAVFISSVIDYNNFLGEFSLRHDDVGSAGSENTFNMSIGYKILDHVTIAASRAKGFKAPNLGELYYPGYGNDELKSEVSHNTEFLVKAHWDNQSLMLVNYDNEVDELIAYDPTRFGSFNIAKANLKGYEVIYKVRQNSFTHKLTASYVDAIDNSIDAATNLPKNIQLLRRAKEHYGYELTVDMGDFSLYTQFNYSGRRRDTDFSSFPYQDVYLDKFVAVNIGASYQVNDQLSFKLKVSDFGENAKPTVFKYNVPGPQVYLSVQYNNF